MSPRTQALVDEIDRWGEADPSRDPAGDLIKLAALEKRVQADGGVPAMTLGNLASAFGAAYFYSQRYGEAADFYGKAAVLFEEGGAPPEEMAGLYSNQATILASIGRYTEAEQGHLKALAIRKQLEGERGPMVASSLFGLGYVYYRQGYVEKSLPYLRQSVEMQEEFLEPGNALTVTRMTSLASVLGRGGREAEGLDWARKAEALGRQYLGDQHQTYAIALNNLGNALIENGLYQEAVPVLREAMRVRQESVGEDAAGTAITMRNLATALKETGNPEEAEQLTRHALEIYQASGDVDVNYALAYLFAELASFSAVRGDWAAYMPQAEKAIAIADEMLEPDNYERAQIHLYHAKQLRKQGRTAEALAIAEQWVPVMQTALIPQHKDRIAAEMLLARLRQEAGTGDAWGQADAAMGMLKEKLADLSMTDRSLAREAETNRDSAMLYFEMALAAQDPERIFGALQLAEISDLSLGQQFADDNRNTVDSAAMEARENLFVLTRATEETRSRYTASLETGDGPATAALSDELNRLEREKRQAETALRRDFPEYAARFRPQPIGLDEFRSILGEKDLLIAPVEGDDEIWIVSITAKGLEWHAAAEQSISDNVVAIRRSVNNAALDAEGYAYDEASALYRTVFPNGVRSGSRILFYGGSTLAYVPFSLMLTSEYKGGLQKAPWLLRKASFQVVGNLSLFGRRPGQVSGSRELAFAGIGGAEMPSAEPAATAKEGVALAGLFRSGRPVLNSIAELPPLPNAAGELQAIADALPGSDDVLLLGPDAAEENFKARDLSKADVIVFATHGLVAGEMRDLWEPALLLGTGSPDGGEDGLLGASEIARLRLNADWVILSACNTSSGDSVGAPLYSGLATAFSQAGARSLMLSHWRLRDDAAARLSVGTVRQAAAGMDRAEALRQAQLALIGDRKVEGAAHPATWAAFIIVQNW
ncbi:CHAT domain-containing tetratricopeptide repeat protein [Altererythrobacter fulvus]|uniref:CHAT domain-containing tetratricopeptide repeat protein n=1 Tax=Caenibius fulvus TaxID=2126012 RepID=UPI0030174F29